jgi:alcohol/geraniol dehydrogenase (NADP+)
MNPSSIRAYVQSGSKKPLALESLSAFGELGPGEVELAVQHCSLCHSDLHLLDGDWGEVARPLVVGHEIVGTIVAKAPDVDLPLGKQVGLGWQAGACGVCKACTSGREHLCADGKLRTCVGRVGGLGERVRAQAKFCFALPDGLELAEIAPLLCAGLTVFSPLNRLGCKAGVRLGVIGFGGLGHLAVQFGKQLGAEVIAFDPDASKRELALKLGASDLLGVGDGLPKAACDLILVTTHVNLDVPKWLSVLDLDGTLCFVGVPSKPLEVPMDPLLDEQKRVTGSVIGSPAMMTEMLSFAAKHKVAPMVEHMPIGACNEAVTRLREGKARMRIVLDW